MRLSSLFLSFIVILAFPSDGAENVSWERLRVPGFWEKQFGGILEAHDGFAWYRCFVRVAADLFNQTGRRRGSRFDCFIAATAILATAEVATVNQGDFKAFVPHGLKLK